MERGYQYNFSDNVSAMYDVIERERKAKTMIAVFNDFLKVPLEKLDALDVGASTGAIDNYLASFFKRVTGIDIDSSAILHAHQYKRPNLDFLIADALHIPFSDNTFDVVICSQIYEHTPDPNIMMEEIARVLKPGGACYFAAGNRFMFMEPHYRLPLLSVIPRPLAHYYIKISGKSSCYYEKHLSYWGLRKLVSSFELIDYTKKIIKDPFKYKADYMLKKNSFKEKIARFIVNFFYWATPGYIWILRKN